MDSSLHRRAGRALASGLVMAIVMGAGLAAPAGAMAAHAPLPFLAVFSGTAGFVGPSTTAFGGYGIATLMGTVVTDGQASITGIVDQPCSGGVANVNVETLTAANGDRLTVTSDDVACPLGPGRYHGVGHWTVSGGTGRFASATGEGTLDGISDFVAGRFVATLRGSVDLER